MQAESRHAFVSLQLKAQRACQVLSKSCLGPAEESGMDVCQETSIGLAAEIWMDSAVSQMALGKLGKLMQIQHLASPLKSLCT